VGATRSPRREIPEDMRAPLALFAALGLAAALSVVVAVLVSALDNDGGDGSAVGGVTMTPFDGEPTPDGSGAAGDTETPTLKPTRTPRPTAVVSPTASPTLSPPTTAAPTPTPVADPAVALWSRTFNEWWPGMLDGSAGVYEEGQTLPFVVHWRATEGAFYEVVLTYDCATSGGGGGIDYLSGIQEWSSQILLGRGGPDRERPDGAVPVPDTSGLTADDADTGVLFMFGGQFTVLPAPVSPDGVCSGQRTMRLSVQAGSGDVWLVGSAHLASESDYGAGQGAASAAGPFGMTATVSGVGTAAVSVQPSAIE